MPMYEPTLYPYSLKFSVGTLVLIMILMLLLLSNVMASNTTLGWSIFSVFSLGFIFIVTVLITKRLLPALKGDIALEVDEEGINDYIRDVSIDWGDIKEIKLIPGRSASTLRIDLKWDSDHGRRIIIALRWVRGKDAEIYETVMAYFEQVPKDFNAN